MAVSEIVGRSTKTGLTAAIAALTMLAAACGSGATTTDVGVAPAPAETTESAESADSSAETGADSSSGDRDEGAAEAAPATNLFPDIEVVNVADATTFNLASELGGGDLPVLLWFWAPH